MGEKSLLDQMLESHVDRQDFHEERRPVSATEKRLARTLDRQRTAAAHAEPERELWREYEAAADALHGESELCGMGVGDRFILQGCSPDVNGRWIVVRIDAGGYGQLYAKRADGNPGYVVLNENKLRDAIHAGLLIPQI